MKKIFLGYSNRDKVLARLLYHYLRGYVWPNAKIFAYEFSLTPGESWADQATNEASSADLGIIVLSEYIKKSEFLPQEVGVLRAKNVPVIYVSLHEEWRIPPGYDASIHSFPMFNYMNPMDALPDLGAHMRRQLSLPAESETEREKKYRVSGRLRDFFVLVLYWHDSCSP